MNCINLLLTNSYIEKLTLLSKEKSSLTSEDIQIKSRKILDKVEKAKIFAISENPSSDFYKEVNEAVRKISLVRPGRKLLKQLLLKAKSPIKIEKSKRARFDEVETIFLSPDANYYYSSNNFLHKHNFEIILAHELIHLVHFLIDSGKLYERKSQTSKLIDSEFHNEEEQLTICGFLEENDPIDLCENAFLEAWNLNLRTDHNGLEVDFPILHFGLDHYIIAKTYGNLQKHLSQYPESVSQLYQLDWLGQETSKKLASKRVCPLTIAAIQNNEKCIDLLIKHGAAITLNVKDELGGPILAACSICKFEIAQKLIAVAQKEKIKLDTEFLLQRLIEGYNKMSYSDDEAFFNVIWEIAMLQKQQLPEGSYTPIFHRSVSCSKERMILCNWLFREKREEALSGIDVEGNNVLIAALKGIEKIPQRGLLKMFTLPKIFVDLLNYGWLDLEHKNHAGETISSIADKISNDFISDALQNAKKKRGYK